MKPLRGGGARAIAHGGEDEESLTSSNNTGDGVVETAAPTPLFATRSNIIKSASTGLKTKRSSMYLDLLSQMKK